MGLKKIILKAFAIALAIPLVYMVVQVGMYEGVISYKLPFHPLYDGRPHWMFEYAMRSVSYQENLRNNIALLLVRLLSSYVIIHGRGRRGIVESILAPSIARIMLLFYVSYWGETTVYVRIPKDLIIPAFGIIGGLLSVVVAKLSKPKPLFERLKEAGFKFEPHRLAHVDVPLRCPHCGAEIHSNAEVCRNCGRSLKEFYVEKIPEELRKYAF